MFFGIWSIISVIGLLVTQGDNGFWIGTCAACAFLSGIENIYKFIKKINIDDYHGRSRNYRERN